MHIAGGNGPATIQHWQLIDRMVQQISLQTKGSDPDQRPLSIDVKKMIKQLASENTMKEVSQKMRELHRESDDLAAKLAKKQRECEIKAEEKVQLTLLRHHFHHSDVHRRNSWPRSPKSKPN